MKTRKVGILLGILVIPLSSTLAYGANLTQAEILFEEAIQNIQAKQYAKAIENFDKILEIEPNHIATLSNKGAALIELEKYEEAIENFDKILEMESTDVATLGNKGVALINLERHEEAIENFDKILEIEPGNLSAIKNRSIAFKKLGFIPIVDSKYLAHLQIQVHNSHGTLVSVTESKTISTLPHPLTDDFLNARPIKEIVEIDNKVYEKREIEIVAAVHENAFIGTTKLPDKKFDGSVTVFTAMSHAYTIESGDAITVVWTILRPVN